MIYGGFPSVSSIVMKHIELLYSHFIHSLEVKRYGNIPRPMDGSCIRKNMGIR